MTTDCARSPTGQHERRDMAGDHTCKHCDAWIGPIPQASDAIALELEQKRDQLLQIIRHAEKWQRYAQRLFWIGIALNLSGFTLLVLNVLRMRTLCGVLP